MDEQSADSRPIAYWDREEAEGLRYETLNEAVEAILVNYHQDGDPETLEVFGFARRVVSLAYLSPLDDVIENLEGEYGGEDGFEKTGAMIAAEREFLAVIQQEYFSWQCEPIVKKTINVAEWRKEVGKPYTVAS